MNKKYDENLLNLLKERAVEDTYMGAPLLIKRIPESDEIGAVDPRLYEDMKKQLQILKILPNKMLKLDTSEKGIANSRKMFNAIKSVPSCTKEITIDEIKVKASDGYEIAMFHYYQSDTTKRSPVLFYMHGGAFFGGHHGVVEESLKLMCEKFAFSIISVDYRLAPEHPYPYGHEDCYTALKWVVENADALCVNKDLLFVGGDSAGGNFAQYCSTRDLEENTGMIKGQLLLYPTLNMAGIEDDYFHWSIDQYQMTQKQTKELTKMLSMFSSMYEGLEPVLKVKDSKNDYLNPYTKNPKNNPPTFLAVGEHDYLKIENLGYGAKLFHAHVRVKMILYKGFGHAFFDNTGVYPQCSDCIEEMGRFILDISSSYDKR
ncbi:MAG: alpha/beta hydrolase fold domain-containing protein [Longicatena sp.]